MFEMDHAAARGDMSVKKLVVFEHDSKWGNVFEDEIENAVIAVKNIENPSSYEDYDVIVKDIDGVTMVVKR